MHTARQVFSKWPRWLIGVAIVLIGIYCAHALLLGKTVYGDGIYYYSWTRSLVVDFNVDFANEYSILGGNQRLTNRSIVANIYPIGAPLIWIPPLLLTTTLFQTSGYSLLDQFTVGLVGVAAVAAAIYLLYRLLNKFFTTSIPLHTILLLVFATNLLFYGAVDTVNTHALSFLASTLLLWFSQKQRPFLAGLSAGWLACIRPQDIVLSLLGFSTITIRYVSWYVLGIVVGLIPQFIAIYSVFGIPTTHPYLQDGAGFLWFKPALISTLLSLNNGLLLYTPVYLLALIGTYQLARTGKKQHAGLTSLARRSIIGFIIQWYIVSSWSIWWQGASYSGRMFISLLPWLSFGLAYGLTHISGTSQRMIVVAFILLNVLVMGLYLLST